VGRYSATEMRIGEEEMGQALEAADELRDGFTTEVIP
jgi:hypothetical protein